MKYEHYHPMTQSAPPAAAICAELELQVTAARQLARSTREFENRAIALAAMMGLRGVIDERDADRDPGRSPGEGARGVRAPKFVPPREDDVSTAGQEDRESAQVMAVRASHLVSACHIQPAAVLDYLREKGQGSYRSLDVAPEAVLAAVVRAWPDVMAEIARGRAPGAAPQPREPVRYDDRPAGA
jgi:hypothetical protein